MENLIKTTQVVDIGKLRRCIYKFPNNKTKYIRFKNEFRKLTSVLREYYPEKSKKGGGEGDNTCLISHQVPDNDWKIVLSMQTYDIRCLARWFKTTASLPHTQQPLTPDEQNAIRIRISQWDETIKKEFIEYLKRHGIVNTIFNKYAIPNGVIQYIRSLGITKDVKYNRSKHSKYSTSIENKIKITIVNLPFENVPPEVSFSEVNTQIDYTDIDYIQIYWEVQFLDYPSCLEIGYNKDKTIDDRIPEIRLTCFNNVDERHRYFIDKFGGKETYSIDLVTNIETIKIPEPEPYVTPSTTTTRTTTPRTTTTRTTTPRTTTTQPRWR